MFNRKLASLMPQIGMRLLHSISRMKVVCFTILVLSVELAAQADPAAAADDVKTREAFYDILDVILADSIAVQIRALQRFIRSHPNFESTYLKLLERYIVHNKQAEATTYFKELAAISAHRPLSQWMLAKLYIIQEDTNAAIEAFRQALYADLPSTMLLKDFVECLHQARITESSAIFLRAKLNARASKLASAFFHFFELKDEQAIHLFRKISNTSPTDFVALDAWGKCYFRLYRYDEADSVWRLGLENSRQNKNLVSEGLFLCNLALVSARAKDRYDQALSYCNSANAIADRLDDRYLKQLILGYSAFVFTCHRNYTEAIKRYQQAIQLASQFGLAIDLATWYHRCAQSFYYSKRYQEALRAYNQCEVLARSANNHELLFLAWLGKGDLYSELRQLALARKTFQDAYDLARKGRWSNKRYFGFACVGLANVMTLEGHFETAIQIYQEFIHQQQWEGNLVHQAYWMSRLAEAYMQSGNSELSRATYMRAYEIAKRADAKQYMPWYLIKAAQMELSEGDIDGAIQKCTVASEIDTSKNNKVLWVELYLTLGNAYKSLGNLSKAISFYSHAAETVEGTRQNIAIEELRVGYFSAWNEIYRCLVQCFLERYLQSDDRADLDSLLYYKERSLGRGLQDMRFRGGTDARYKNQADLDNGYQKACEQLRITQSRIRRQAQRKLSVDEWNHLLSQLEAARYSLVAQRLQAVKKLSLSVSAGHSPVRFASKILKDLQPAELGLLLYHISEKGSFALIAANKEIRVLQLQVTPAILSAALDSLMAPFHLIEENAKAFVPFRAGIAYRLYRLLIEPAEVALKLPQKLLIVPDFVLMNLPFEMLLVAAPDKPEYTPVEFPNYAEYFLLHRYTIIYSPTTALLEKVTKPLSGKPNILIFADPFGSASKTTGQTQFRSRTGWSFDALPFSEVEARRIAKTYSSTKVYTRAAAKKAVFMHEAPQQNIVHIATHAFVDTTFEAFSGLVLSAGEDSTDDGMLMGYEIADLNLSCDLITLSACETGRGKVVAGEGILGLPRLFLGAGAKTVLMTLWKVDDKFASELMPDFYHHLLNQRLSKVEALNKAKQFILRKVQLEHGVYYQHPFYWASFVLYGESGVGQGFSPILAGLIGLLIMVLILAIYYRVAQRRNRT